MAFTDNFNGAGSTTNLESWTPSGGGTWTLGAGASGAATVLTAGELKSNTATASYYTCTDQGTADHYVSCRSKQLVSTLGSSFVATRLVDASNCVGWRIAGTGSTGRRLSKIVSGTITDLITSQGVDEEWIRVEASGNTFKLFQGGTGGSPSWSQVGADQTVTGFSTETSQGFRIGNNTAGGWVDDFEAGGLNTSYTISPSGGLTFSGDNVQIHGKIFAPSGGLTFGGSNTFLHGKVFNISGGITFGGTAVITSGTGTSSYTITPTGGFTFAGNNAVNLGKVFNISGGITFSGNAALSTVNSYALSPSGGVIFGGTNLVIKTKILSPTGGIVFSGTANIHVPSTGVDGATVITLRRYIGRR